MKDTFGKTPAAKVLDTLLENCPHKRSVGRYINRYREELKLLLSLDDCDTKWNLIQERYTDWKNKINSKNWDINIKTFTLNILSTIYKQYIKND